VVTADFMPCQLTPSRFLLVVPGPQVLRCVCTWIFICLHPQVARGPLIIAHSWPQIDAEVADELALALRHQQHADASHLCASNTRQVFLSVFKLLFDHLIALHQAIK
jgi:hypothetical protein